MPTVNCFAWEGRSFRMAHATPQGDMFEYLPMDQWGERVKGLDVDFVLLGHTHIQGTRSFDKLSVVNPGSVGLARDKPGEACYALFEDGQIKLKRVSYEVGRTLAALRKAPLSDTVYEGLARVLGNPPAGASSAST
jgi:predicted phosphodiesterase